MDFINDWFRKSIFSDNQDSYDTDFEDNEVFSDEKKSGSIETSDSIQGGVLSSMAEGLSSIAATVKNSVSDYGRRLSLFNGSTSNPISTSVGLRQPVQTSTSSINDGFGIGSYGSVIPSRVRAESCGARPYRTHGFEKAKYSNRKNTQYANGGNASNLKRSRATNNLNFIEATLGNNQSSTSAPTPDGSVSVQKRGPTCAIEESSIPEMNEHETASPDAVQGELSFMDIVRNNLHSLHMNIVLRHRRFNKRGKRQRLADYYRKKYNTETAASSKANELIEETETDAKSKGMSRLFDFVRSKFTGQSKSRTDSVRKRVAIKMENRKKLYKGQSRAEIVAHFRGKYSKNN